MEGKRLGKGCPWPVDPKKKEALVCEQAHLAEICKGFQVEEAAGQQLPGAA